MRAKGNENNLVGQLAGFNSRASSIKKGAYPVEV